MNTLEPGSLFGKYRIHNMIGRGGMGVVYVAEDTSLGRRVALKVLSPDLVSSSAFEERFRREARIVASLNHPNIVQIHSLDNIDGRLVIDMTYVEGGSLADAEAMRRATLSQSLQSVGDALAGLASCHQVGIIHRDVKPSNILLGREGIALLSDFGLSKCLAAHHEAAVSSMASSCLFLGTPRYAPPESWEGKEPTPSWDVYSAGAVIYEAASGHAPHEANSPLELIRSIYENAVPPLSDINEAITPALSKAVAQMLAQNPNDRPQNASAALTLLSECPEFAEKKSARLSTIVQVKWPPKSAPFRFRLAKMKRPLVILAAAVLIFAIASLLPLKSWFSSLPGEGARPRAPSDHYVFNTTDTLTSERWAEHWLMIRGGEQQTWQVLASKGTDLIYLQASPNDESFDFLGHWAHYTDKTARAFRHGTVQGAGKWVRENELMTAVLQFECALDGSRWQGAFLLDRTVSDEPPGQFMAALESTGLFARLVYCELIPRNLDWAEEVENLFIAKGIPKVTVPFLAGSDAPMQIDGQATETIWRQAAANAGPESGVLNAQSEGSGATLTVCRDKSQLYFYLASPTPLDNPALTLRLLTQCDAQPNQIISWKLVVDQSNAIQLHKVAGDKEYPQNSHAVAVSSGEAKGHRVEMAMPFTDLELEEGPLPDTRWRLSGAFADAQVEPVKAAVYWGRAAGASPVHGAILLFGPSE
ncbi:MAG TPA: serine/threonine-protein kinase [Candidatus Hydrogenedentes bacterium]|nr:serine/threonine-protein kinase [Candidatus Hydrogenedentota bacterium]HQH51670.1 serine/threonine-protein kinase [Candidatus Hydrogenedentota bacterium]